LDGERPDGGAPGAAHPVAVLGAPADEVHLAHVAEQEAVRRQRGALAEQRAPRLHCTRADRLARGVDAQDSTGAAVRGQPCISMLRWQHGRPRAPAARAVMTAAAAFLVPRCCVTVLCQAPVQRELLLRQTATAEELARLQQPRDGRALLEQCERGVRAQHRARHWVIVQHEAAHGARGQAQRLQRAHTPQLGCTHVIEGYISASILSARTRQHIFI